jgi:hypothetical protein
MKTFLALSLTLAGIASASTISESCGSTTYTAAPGTGASLTGALTPTGSFTCASLGPVAGIISSIQLFYAADYSFGQTITATNTVLWTFTASGGVWAGGTTDQVTGGFSSSGNTPAQATGFLDPPFNGASTTPGQQSSTDPGLGVGTSVFGGVGGTSSANVTAGSVTSTTGGVFAQITYAPATTGTPEPATLGLMGSALMGLGLLARRKK